MLKTYTPRFMTVRAVQLPDVETDDIDDDFTTALAKYIRTNHNMNVFETDEGLGISTGEKCDAELLGWGDYFVETENPDGTLSYEIVYSVTFERQYEEAR